MQLQISRDKNYKQSACYSLNIKSLQIHEETEQIEHIKAILKNASIKGMAGT